ncbi:AraC family transcriptional regulator [Microvirga thermotolerans]|uniref:Helix-turn-helix domain-containing protein n=1 Tax=Microvirga thermotolerans TaxID=2651334 RepID=A0A5P9K2M0_9HYPH|nr:AraC family transcriptional regulator [Microvirga thermotolerans]QFU17885.1 helix-turn-helix domain-containing protein [Microvirga thermotolerans]
MPQRKVVHPIRKGLSALPTAVGVLSRLAAERVIQAGLDVDALLGRAGVPISVMNDPNVRVTVRSQIQFLNLVADALQDNLLGFHIALDFDLRELGSFYYVMASSERLGDAIAREAHYSSIVNEGLRVSYQRTSGFTVDFEYVGVERHHDKHEMEFWVTCTLRKSRFFTNRELVPSFVSFIHRHEGDLSEMERYFACSLTFGGSVDRLSFEPQAADLPLVTADPYLNRFLVEDYEKAIARRPHRDNPLRIRVENAITPRLPHGTATIGNIAKDLGMSPRTLSRRLAEEGLTFSMVLDELRSVLAKRYLENSELSISQITWLLGYTEASSFVHAFQRWAGMSPTDARRQIKRELRFEDNQEGNRL